MRRVLVLLGAIGGALIGLAAPASAATDVLTPGATAFYQINGDLNGVTTTQVDAGPLTTATYESGHGAPFIVWRAVYPLPKAAACMVSRASFSTYVRSFDPEPPLFPDSPPPVPFARLSLSRANGDLAGEVRFTPEVGVRQSNDVTAPIATSVVRGSKTITVSVSAGMGAMRWDGPGNPTPPALTITCTTGDNDRDGVLNTRDICSSTPWRDDILHLKPNNYANRSRHFVSGAAADSGVTLDDTAGCSAIQIGSRLGGSQALSILSSGIPLPTLQAWVAAHRPS